jgi:hypothetical protein
MNNQPVRRSLGEGGFFLVCTDSHDHKNWLFVGSPEVGKRSAVMYTLLISARNQGVDPPPYLKDLIERLPTTCPSEFGELLPATWAAANRAAHPAIKSERSQAA